MPCIFLAIPDRSAKEANRPKVQPGGWNASQNEVAMTTGPLGESFRGLQGVEAGLRSEAKLCVQVGCESVRVGGDRAWPVRLRLYAPVNVSVDSDSGLLAGI